MVTITVDPTYRPPYRLRKNVVWSRMTDTEADTFDAALQNATTRNRRMWDDAQYLDSQDSLFAYLHDQMTQVFGEARADELLAPADEA